MTCTPASLVASAICYAQELSRDDLSAAQLYLACQWATHLLPEAVVDWAARVVVNGGAGAAPSETTKTALGVFYNGLVSEGILSKMIAVNCVAPDNLIASITPLIVGPGSDPWTNMGPFIATDLTVDGLKGNGVGKYLRTGVIPSTAFSNNTSVGITTYNMTALNASIMEAGAQSGGGGVDILQYINSWSDAAKSTYFDAYDFASALVLPNPSWVGYLSSNRTAINAAAIYRASDTVPFETLGATVAGGGSRPNVEIYIYGLNQSGVLGFPSSRRLSFMGIHLGLTSAESQQLYNLVRALRGSFQGGFV